MASNDWGAFESLNSADNYNIIASSMGRGGSGKSHFWLTAPDPIAYFLFDPAGLKGLRNNPLFKERDIRVLDFSAKFNLAFVKDRTVGKDKESVEARKRERSAVALEMVEAFDEGFEVALSKARTIVIDKEDALWEGMRYAHNENYSTEPKEYYELNMAYRGLFQRAESAGVNLGVIRGVKEAWGKTGVNTNTGKPTYGGLGYDVARGQKEVTELVQINLEHSWDDANRVFMTRVLEKCRLGNALELLGREFQNLDFITLATTLYPDVDPDVWL